MTKKDLVKLGSDTAKGGFKNEKDVFDPTLAASGVADTFDVYYPEGYRVNNHTNT